MSVAAPSGYQDRIDLKVHQLRGSGLSERSLRLAALSTLRQRLPLRDAIVLREARRFTPPCEAVRAWIAARRVCRHGLPTSTYRIWIKPLRPVGAEGNRLLVSAPEGIRSWVERRYTSLLREALQGTGYTDVELVEGEPCR